MAKTPEGLFQEKLLRSLRKVDNAWWLRAHMAARAGIPDILGCMSGFFVAIEVKKDAKSKATKLQKYVLNKIHKAGGIALVVCPENFEDCMNYLQDVRRRFKDASNIRGTARPGLCAWSD